MLVTPNYGRGRKYGVTLLTVRQNRNSQMRPNPDGDLHVCTGDLLVVIGPPDKVVSLGLRIIEVIGLTISGGVH